MMVMVAAPLAAFWFGGAPVDGVPTLVIAIAAGCVLAADLLGPPESTGGRIVTALLAALLFAGGWYMGARELERAASEVANHADDVRQALKQHYDTWSEYPDSLDDVADLAVPGRRLLRGPMLHYRQTALGYEMWFEDDMGRYVANDAHGFQRQ